MLIELTRFRVILQMGRPRVTTIRTQSIGPPCPQWDEAERLPWWFFWVIGLLVWMIFLCCMLCLRPILRKKYRKRVEKKLNKRIMKYGITFDQEANEMPGKKLKKKEKIKGVMPVAVCQTVAVQTDPEEVRRYPRGRRAHGVCWRHRSVGLTRDRLCHAGGGGDAATQGAVHRHARGAVAAAEGGGTVRASEAASEYDQEDQGALQASPQAQAERCAHGLALTSGGGRLFRGSSHIRVCGC
jgi:hypothetical protein